VAAVSVSFSGDVPDVRAGHGAGDGRSTLTAQYRARAMTAWSPMSRPDPAHDRGHVACPQHLGYIGPHAAALMGVAPDVYDGALGFMRVSFVAAVQFLFFVFQSIMRGVGSPAGGLYRRLHRAANFLLDPCSFSLGSGARLWRDGPALRRWAPRAWRRSSDCCAGMGRHGIHVKPRDFISRPQSISSAPSTWARPPRSSNRRERWPVVMTFLIASFGPRPWLLWRGLEHPAGW